MKISRWARAACAVVLSAAATLTAAAPYTFGPRTLNIPQPDGYDPASVAKPQLFELGAAFTPATNRMAEFFVASADAEALLSGKIDALPRYFQVQVPRSLDGKPLSAAEFRANSKTIESSLEEAMKQAGTQAKDLLKQANANVEQKFGADPGVSISDVGYHGVFRREDWGLFFTMSSQVTAAESAGSRMFCAGAVALIDHQIVYFYAYSLERTPADREWAKRTLNAWVDAVRLANPDDAAVEATATASSSGSNFWVRTLAFAVFGGLIGVLYGNWRKRRA
jgi:hypothetical protein